MGARIGFISFISELEKHTKLDRNQWLLPCLILLETPKHVYPTAPYGNPIMMQVGVNIQCRGSIGGLCDILISIINTPPCTQINLILE